MLALLIRHNVSDHDAWRQVFEGDVETLRANGAGEARVFHSDLDRNEVWLLMEWDDLARARLFVRSDESLDLLARAGVTGRPDYWFLDEAARGGPGALTPRQDLATATDRLDPGSRTAHPTDRPPEGTPR